MKTGIFRGGCLTGPSHSGVELHGFLNYLVLVALAERPYTIFGYKGKQVRDQIHSHDVINAFWNFAQNPRPGEVYNLGGGRDNAASVIECIDMIEKASGKRPQDHLLARPTASATTSAIIPTCASCGPITRAGNSATASTRS